MRSAVRPPCASAASIRWCARLLIVELLRSGTETGPYPLSVWSTAHSGYGAAATGSRPAPGRPRPGTTGAAPVGILDMFRLDDRVAIVTGASSGLGAVFARALAEAGADV